MTVLKIPDVIGSYAEQFWGLTGNDPIIVEEFTPGKGWKRQSYQKRPSISWLRKLKAQGVERIGVALPTNPRRVADFGIAEVIRGEGKSLPMSARGYR